MASKTTEENDVVTALTNAEGESRRSSKEDEDLLDGNVKKKKKNSGEALANFVYNPRKKTVLGRDALNWAKLSAFYTVFYFFLGCFFVFLVYVFASILDRSHPRYYNTESTMAVRSVSAVVGLGFRPQPSIDESLIRITDDPEQQEKMASSLRLFRDVFLLQNSDAKTEQCSASEPAQDLPEGVACSFDWSHIVKTKSHPCSDDNLYGFKQEKPCILVKLNKVYGWAPVKGVLPVNIQNLRGIHNNKSIDKSSDVYITCAGTNPVDDDVLTDITYYSLDNPSGSSKLGVIPNYFFPYRNARDHVQPFVLVQFNKLPLKRLVSVTCRAWAPNIEHDIRRMRGMVTFKLYRSHRDIKSDQTDD